MFVSNLWGSRESRVTFQEKDPFFKRSASILWIHYLFTGLRLSFLNPKASLTVCLNAVEHESEEMAFNFQEFPSYDRFPSVTGPKIEQTFTRY